MNDDLLPPLFQLAAGLSFIIFLLVSLKARPAFTDLAGRLVGFGVLMVTLSLLILSHATRGSMSAGANFFVAAGVVLLVGVCLLAAAVLVTANRLTGRAR